MVEQTVFYLPNKRKKFEKINYSDIIYLEGCINYTLIHLKSGRVKISPRTLLYHIQRSLNESFIRIHRAFCINKNYLETCDAVQTPQYLQLQGRIRLAVSRRESKILREFIV